MFADVRTRPSLMWPLHAAGLYEARTQTSQAERDTLAHFARGQSSLAEIGVFQGVTARLLSSVMDPAGTYFAVDPYPGGKTGVNFAYYIAKREVAKGAVGEVVWIKAFGKDAPRDPRLAGREVDFLFIDGDHSYEGLRGDWEAWRPLVTMGGIVGFHDTRGGRFGCERYLREVILKDVEFEVVAEVDSLTVVRRLG